MTFFCIYTTTGTLDIDGTGVDDDGVRTPQRKLQRSPKVVKARPQQGDEEQSFESSMENSGPKLQNSRKRSVERRGKVSGTRKTNKNGKLSVASGAAEAAGSPDYDSRNCTEGEWDYNLFSLQHIGVASKYGVIILFLTL